MASKTACIPELRKTYHPLSIKSILINRWPLVASIVFVILLISSYFFSPGLREFTHEAYNILLSDDKVEIRKWVSALGFWGPLFIIVAMVVQIFLFFMPSPVLMVISVLAYGPIWGSALAIGSVMVASIVGYFVGRLIGEDALYKLIGKSKEDKLESYVGEYGLWVVVISRLSPAFSNDAVSLVAGIVKLNFWKFLLATFVGITPLAILIAWFGENNQRLQSGLIWISVIGVLFLLGYIIFDHWRKKETRTINNSSAD